MGYENKEHSDALKKNLQTRIAIQIQDRGLNQAEAARILGLHAPRISEIANQRGEFSVDSLMGYAKKLGLNLKIEVKNVR